MLSLSRVGQNIEAYRKHRNFLVLFFYWLGQPTAQIAFDLTLSLSKL